ncbi:protein STRICTOSIDINE SYNTHASE-LIKE 10 [Gossypium hirsutum]|uniref:Protein STRICTOSIDINE SYNTHASE-LIKE 10 n=1 Tax=Gossypium hirsutum TaxID=3635 RepID=A0A1U8N430_GOSHI|nr:protein STRICTOSIDINE SYNTHASE-LIKE 10-like [Gossypium hirsutum]
MMMNSFKFLFSIFCFTFIKQSYQSRIVISKSYNQFNLTNVVGPESIAFDCKGEGPYVGVSDGRILKHELNFGWKEFAIPSLTRRLCDGSTNLMLEPICGRALGLKFNDATCDLYIADAYFGLLMVGPKGGVAQVLANSSEGIPFRFTNGLDIDNNTGVVYFTDSSIIFQRRYADLLSRSSTDRTGRLLRYDPRAKRASVMYKGLMFPNGVALSQNRSFLLVAKTIRKRILKFNLGDEGGLNNNEPKVFAKLPRVPNNIKMNENGEFWVALNTGRLGETSNDGSDPIGVKYDGEGSILQELDGNRGTIFNSISEVNEVNRTLYISSVVKPYVGVLKI